MMNGEVTTEMRKNHPVIIIDPQFIDALDKRIVLVLAEQLIKLFVKDIMIDLIII